MVLPSRSCVHRAVAVASKHSRGGAICVRTIKLQRRVSINLTHQQSQRVLKPSMSIHLTAASLTTCSEWATCASITSNSLSKYSPQFTGFLDESLTMTLNASSATQACHACPTAPWQQTLGSGSSTPQRPQEDASWNKFSCASRKTAVLCSIHPRHPNSPVRVTERLRTC